MNSRLEQFVRDVEVRLTALPPEAREQEITEIRLHLESLAAAEQALGASEREAAEAAIRQFGDARELAAELNLPAWRLRLKRLPESAVTVLSVAAAYPVFLLGIRFLLAPALQAVLPPKPFSMPAGAMVLLAPIMEYCAIGALCAFILGARDGWRATRKRLLTRQTVAGGAVLWILLFQGLSAVARAVFAHFHTPFDRIPNSPVGWTNDVLIMMTIPLIASLLIGVAGCDRPVRSAMIAYLTVFGIQQLVWIASVATSGVLFASGTTAMNFGLTLLSGIPPAVIAAVAAWCIARRPRPNRPGRA